MSPQQKWILEFVILFFGVGFLGVGVGSYFLPWYTVQTTTGSCVQNSLWSWNQRETQCTSCATCPGAVTLTDWSSTKTAQITRATQVLLIIGLAIFLIGLLLHVIPWCGCCHDLTVYTVPWWFYLIAFIVVLGTVITYAVGLPLALNADNNNGANPPCTSGCTSSFIGDQNGNQYGPGTGWILALVTDILFLIFMIILVFHKSSPIKISEMV